ncbi:MAG: hypothetical protein ACRELB_22400, partial [Polyangiaceae bacterium]
MTLRARPWRLLRLCFAVLAGGWLLYLIAVNVVIRTRLLRNLISEDPGAMRVDYASAYSLVPGRIHVEGLRIRGRDSHVEWILTLDRCDFRVAFADLLHRRFHADHVHGDGLSLRVRQREPSFTTEEAAALPPVPGFSDPPLAGPPPPPLTDADYDLWSIWLEGVVADHVREIWIDTLRYTGDVQVRGRWFFRPVRWLDVGPATVTAHTLTVSRGLHETWVEGAMGQVVVTVHPFDVRSVRGVDVVHQVSVAGDVRATAKVAAFADHALEGSPAHADAGTAELQTHVAIDHGVLHPGTVARLEPFAARGHAGGLALAATLAARIRVDGEGVGHAALDAAAVHVAQGTFPRAHADHLAATLRARDLDLVHPFSDARYTLDVRGMGADSLRYWSALAPLGARLAIDSGAVAIDGHLEGSIPGRDLSGSADVRVIALHAGDDGTRAGGDLAATLRVSASLRDHRYDLSGSELELDDLAADLHGLRLSAPRLRARAPRLVIAEAGVLGRVTLDLPSVAIPSVAPVGAVIGLPCGIVIQGGRAAGDARGVVD